LASRQDRVIGIKFTLLPDTIFKKTKSYETSTDTINTRKQRTVGPEKCESKQSQSLRLPPTHYPQNFKAKAQNRESKAKLNAKHRAKI
jgi:hypothetical protein